MVVFISSGKLYVSACNGHHQVLTTQQPRGHAVYAYYI